MTTPIINIADLELGPRPAAFAPTEAAAERFDARMGYIGPRIGAQEAGLQHHGSAPENGAFLFTIIV